MSRTVPLVLTVGLACIAGGTAKAGSACGDPVARRPSIEEIRFEGNRRTRPATLLREMLVRPGDPADPERIERSRQAIMDLELFKSVAADLRPGTDGEILVIRVEEKHYYFVLPALSRTGEGDLTFGVQAELDNLWGRDHHFEIEAVRKNFSSDADVDNERRVEVAYRYPRMLDGPWELDSSARFQKAFLEEDRDGVLGDYDSDSVRLRLFATRWMKPAGPSRGWRFGTGVLVEDFRFRLIEGEPGLFFDTTEVGLLGGVLYDGVHSYDLSRSGRQFSYDLQVFTEQLGSAKNRLIHDVRFRTYHLVTQRRHTNLNLQLRWELATESLFGDPTFSLGGSTRLRGYDRQAIEGDALILANLEFLTPFSRIDALRAVVFLDVGDAFRDSGQFTLGDLAAGAGAGLRWKLRSFVKVDLRLDVARGLDGDRGGTTKLYAGTDATF